MQTLLQEIDETANDYNKTKDPYYKNKWYKHKPNVEHFIDNYILKG